MKKRNPRMVVYIALLQLLAGHLHVGQAHLLRERGEIIPAGATKRHGGLYGGYTIRMRMKKGSWEIESSRSWHCVQLVWK